MGEEVFPAAKGAQLRRDWLFTIKSKPIIASACRLWQAVPTRIGRRPGRIVFRRKRTDRYGGFRRVLRPFNRKTVEVGGHGPYENGRGGHLSKFLRFIEIKIYGKI